MTTSTLIHLGIGLVLIAYICSKQLSWRPVDAVILALSGLFAVASGTLMGRIARFRPSPVRPGTIESRTGWLGVGIWLGLITVRVALDVAGHRMGSELAVSTGTILLVLAL